MERKQFLKSLGAGAAFALTFPCLHGCSSDDTEGSIIDEPTGINFTIDLTSDEALELNTNGGFILKEFVVVVKNLEGDFIAASQICSHRGYDQVRFQSVNGGIFHCDVHGASFEQNGTPLNNVTSNPLTIYNTELDGDILRVFE